MMILDHDDVYIMFQKQNKTKQNKTRHGIHMKWGLSHDDVTGEFLKDKETFDDIFNGTLKDKNVVAVKAYKDLSQELELNFLQAKTLQTT